MRVAKEACLMLLLLAGCTQNNPQSIEPRTVQVSPPSPQAWFDQTNSIDVTNPSIHYY